MLLEKSHDDYDYVVSVGCLFIMVQLLFVALFRDAHDIMHTSLLIISDVITAKKFPCTFFRNTNMIPSPFYWIFYNVNDFCFYHFHL